MPTELRRRRDAARREQTRGRLLDAAAAVFARDGFHRPRISDIVGRAGLGQGTFYRHFRSKREALDALFDRLLAELMAEFRPLSDPLPRDLASYRAASRDVVGRLAAVLERERGLVLLFLRQGPSIDAGFERRLAETYDGFARLAGLYLDHAVAQGFARPCDSGLVAQALVGIGLRMVDLWLAGRLGGRPIDALVDELIDLAFCGIGEATKGDAG